MANYTKINIGTSPNSGDGDNLREAFNKLNGNIDEQETLESSLQSQITQETSDRQAADSTLQANIDALKIKFTNVTIPAATLTTISHNKGKFCTRAVYVDTDGFIQNLMHKNAADNNSVEVYSALELTSVIIYLTF